MTSTSPKAGTGLLRDTRRNIAAATALLSAVVMFFVAETVSAAAWQRRLGIGFGIGLTMAAFLHESPAWSLPFHALGATLAMGGGNIAIILTGLLGARLGVPGWLARGFTALGTVGLAFFLVVRVLALTDSAVLPHGIGALERGAAYPVLATQLIVAVGLLVESARLRKRSVQPLAARPRSPHDRPGLVRRRQPVRGVPAHGGAVRRDARTAHTGRSPGDQRPISEKYAPVIEELYAGP